VRLSVGQERIEFATPARRPLYFPVLLEGEGPAAGRTQIGSTTGNVGVSDQLVKVSSSKLEGLVPDVRLGIVTHEPI
jgi:hypothetical protein